MPTLWDTLKGLNMPKGLNIPKLWNTLKDLNIPDGSNISKGLNKPKGLNIPKDLIYLSFNLSLEIYLRVYIKY